MTSIRKIESNKRNASRSTGPRTPGGKLRSRTNARRHGLAMRIEDDPEAKGGIEFLTATLVEGTDDFERREQARILAGCYFDLNRIRAARYDVFSMMDDLEAVSGKDFEVALRAMDSISRYETRTLSKRRKALRKSACI
jgi:hypothetical protein